MKPATEEFLYFLLWAADPLIHPTYRNFNTSFETWAYRNRLTRRLAELERRKLLERRPGDSGGERFYRLTTRGRQAALLGIDPIERWARHWDGKWRLVFFDVPEEASHRRTQLRRFLRGAGFGYLQGSVWLSPDPLDALNQRLKGADINTESLVLFEGRPCGGESDEALVRGAWDFEQINKAYAAWTLVANRAPKLTENSERGAKLLQAWGRAELAAWRDVTQHDPFLPKSLWPKNYAGERIWARRRDLLHSLRNLFDQK